MAVGNIGRRDLGDEVRNMKCIASDFTAGIHLLSCKALFVFQFQGKSCPIVASLLHIIDHRYQRICVRDVVNQKEQSLASIKDMPGFFSSVNKITI